MSVSDPFNPLSEGLPDEGAQDERPHTAPHSDKALYCITATFVLIIGLAALGGAL